MIGGRHRSNMELVAQGMANVVTPLFGGIPATGAIARTATNVKSGGRTPVAGMVHALTLLMITLFFGRLAGLIPLATLAAIVLWVAYRMAEWQVFRNELSAPRERRARDGSDLSPHRTGGPDHRHRRRDGAGVLPVHETDGGGHERAPWYPRSSRTRAQPGSVRRHLSPCRSPRAWRCTRSTARSSLGPRRSSRTPCPRFPEKPKVLIVRMRNVPAIDSTAMHALRDLVRRTRKDGTLVLLSDVPGSRAWPWSAPELLEEIGEELSCAPISTSRSRWPVCTSVSLRSSRPDPPAPRLTPCTCRSC